MKKILISLVLAAILAMPIATALAQGPQECCKLRRAIQLDEGGTALVSYAKNAIVGPAEGGECGISAITKPTTNWGILCLLNTFNGIVDWMFTILMVLVIFFTILGAFNIIMAGGSAEKVAEGKNYILYAAIGLAVAFLARALPGIVKMVMGY